MTEDEMRGLFFEMRDDVVPAESLRRVRLAVAERTRARVRIKLWTVAAFAVTACALLIIAPREQPKENIRRTGRPAIIARQEDPSALLPGKPSRIRARSRRVAPSVPETAATSVKKIEGNSAVRTDAVIRIETADPDVVILLIED